ncbi:hypothetical protein JW964_06190 [candidate division KSB1 bacterium]|nr:hypothetical protein [candidate division KSB1 bacterium]
MNPILQAGTRVVVLALIFYSIAIFTEQRKHLATNLVLTTLSIGIILDITATIFMIIGSPNSPFTLHGFLGYSALLVMSLDTIFIWRFRMKNLSSVNVPPKLHLYSRYAYLWWVIAFITGGLLVIFR